MDARQRRGETQDLERFVAWRRTERLRGLVSWRKLTLSLLLTSACGNIWLAYQWSAARAEAGKVYTLLELATHELERAVEAAEKAPAGDASTLIVRNLQCKLMDTASGVGHVSWRAEVLNTDQRARRFDFTVWLLDADDFVVATAHETDLALSPGQQEVIQGGEKMSPEMARAVVGCRSRLRVK